METAANTTAGIKFASRKETTGAEAVMWQRVEGAIVFAASIALAMHWNTLPLWSVLLIFFAPDLSMFGYLFGSKVGAFCYNTVHVYAFGAAVLALGLLMALPLIQVLGALFLAHPGFDRMLAYGLKSPDSFNSTHMGRIGKQA